ncbi:MAG: hypothetical protein HUJ78_06420 [Mogibacterium sp.]|nr:hypothetical protein [Mogibacterium sp.]
MASYYYLIASLPELSAEGDMPITSDEFLDACKPDVAVISVGRNNIYGHPHEQTLTRLEERGIKTYRTDLQGAIGIDVKRNGKYSIEPVRIKKD